MNSLFRIDRSLIRNNDSIDDIVVIPGLPEIEPDERDEDELTEESVFEEQSSEEVLDEALEKKKRELAELQKKVEEAKAEAENILKQADADAKALHEKSKQDGYNAGMEQAEAEFQEKLKQENADFEKSVKTLAAAKAEIFDQIEASVLDLSLYIAEQVVKETLDKKDEIFLNIVKDTLSRIKDQSDIVIRVNQSEYDRFFADDSEEFTALLLSSGIEIKQDIAVERGECVLETEFGTIKTGIQTQLKSMADALYEAG